MMNELNSKGALNFVSEASFWEPEAHGLSETFPHAPFIFWLFDLLKPKLVVDTSFPSDSLYTFNDAVKKCGLECTCLPFKHDLPFPNDEIDLLYINCHDESFAPPLERMLVNVSEKTVILISGPSSVAGRVKALKNISHSFRFSHGNGLAVLGNLKGLPEKLGELLSIAEQSSDHLAVLNVYQRLSNLLPSQQLLCTDERIDKLHEERFKQITDKEKEYAKLNEDFEAFVKRASQELVDKDNVIENLLYQVHCLNVKNNELETTVNRSAKSIHQLSTNVEHAQSVIRSFEKWQNQSWQKRLFQPWERAEITGS